MVDLSCKPFWDSDETPDSHDLLVDGCGEISLSPYTPVPADCLLPLTEILLSAVAGSSCGPSGPSPPAREFTQLHTSLQDTSPHQTTHHLHSYCGAGTATTARTQSGSDPAAPAAPWMCHGAGPGGLAWAPQSCPTSPTGAQHPERAPAPAPTASPRSLVSSWCSGSSGS